MAGVRDAAADALGRMNGTGPVVVAFPFVGDLVGGSHISACGLIRALDPARFAPLLLLQHPEGAIGDLFRAAGVAVEGAPGSAALAHGRRIGAGAALALGARSVTLARFLKARGVGIVHGNDGRTLATWGLAAKLGGARLLWHHRASPHSIGLRLAAPLLADQVVAVSQFAGARAAGAQVVHSPFDTMIAYDRAVARAAIVAAVPGSDHAVHIGFSGALIDRKRPLLFVDAIAAMRRHAPARDIRGLLFGEGLDGMAERVEARAAMLGIPDAVHVMGFQTPGAFWLAGCDLLMVPAVDEPFGRTLIEAMLAGTPVVATASGGNGEAIRDGETGLLVPPEDADALAIACLALVADPARAATIAATAQAEARRRFGIKAHADHIMTIYDAMLGRAVHR
jgi:glycosyltransferase involved in cell wall biosynthesis